MLRFTAYAEYYLAVLTLSIASCYGCQATRLVHWPMSMLPLSLSLSFPCIWYACELFISYYSLSLSLIDAYAWLRNTSGWFRDQNGTKQTSDMFHTLGHWMAKNENGRAKHNIPYYQKERESEWAKEMGGISNFNS